MYTETYLAECKNKKISLKQDKVILADLKPTEILVKVNCCLFSCQHFLNERKEGNYSAANQIAGIIQKVGCLVKRFQVNDQVIGFVMDELNSSGLSQYCIIDEDFCYNCPSAYSEIAVALLNDFFTAKLSFIRLSDFPKPHTFLVLNPLTPIGHIFIHLAKQTGAKVVVYTQNVKDFNEIRVRYPDIVVLNDSTQSLFTAVMEETFNIGASCIVDLFGINDWSHVSDCSSIPNLEIVNTLSLGGTIISFSPDPYSGNSSLKVLQNKSASIIFPLLRILLKSRNYTEIMINFADDLIKQIEHHALKPGIIQTIKFSEIDLMISSENIEALSNNYRVVIVN